MFPKAKPEDEEGRRGAHTAQFSWQGKSCFTAPFLSCSVTDSFPQEHPNTCFMPEGSGPFWDGES